MASKNWIQQSVPKSHEGKFAAKAHAAGKTTAEYAKEKAHAPGVLGAEAREAATLMHLNPNKGAPAASMHEAHKQRFMNHATGKK